MTQGFGENPADYARFGLKGHNGLDYGLPINTAVKAPHSGKVIEDAFDANGYGNYLKIENDIEGSVLAHLNSCLVYAGDQVTEGQVIAYSDNTGNSTGPHLHWGYYKIPRDRQNGYAGFIDQLPLLNSAIIAQPIAQENTQPMKQIIIDVYRAICGVEPSPDEVQARLDSKINTYDLTKDILYNDGRSAFKVQLGDLSRQLNECLNRTYTIPASSGTTTPVDAPKTADIDESDLTTKPIDLPPIVSKLLGWLRSKLGL